VRRAAALAVALLALAVPAAHAGGVDFDLCRADPERSPCQDSIFVDDQA
jgi:hypothetical protein